MFKGKLLQRENIKINCCTINKNQTYIGEMKFRIPHGFGQITTANYEYIGEFINGKPEGKGEMTFKNGRIDTGVFENGVLHGEGRRRNKNGKIIEGIFLHDEIQTRSLPEKPGSEEQLLRKLVNPKIALKENESLEPKIVKTQEDIEKINEKSLSDKSRFKEQPSQSIENPKTIVEEKKVLESKPLDQRQRIENYDNKPLLDKLRVEEQLSQKEVGKKIVIEEKKSIDPKIQNKHHYQNSKESHLPAEPINSISPVKVITQPSLNYKTSKNRFFKSYLKKLPHITKSFYGTSIYIYPYLSLPSFLDFERSQVNDTSSDLSKHHSMQGVYHGEYHNNNYHGKGKITFINQEYYIGNWKDNKLSGYGEYFYLDGSVYRGHFRDNLRHGLGVFQSITVTIKGNWQHNQQHGRAKLFWEGHCAEGMWYEGKLQGTFKVWNTYSLDLSLAQI